MATIYVIFHVTFDGTNIITLDETKIADIIREQSQKYEGTDGEWRWRKIVEGEEFEADMNNLPVFSK